MLEQYFWTAYHPIGPEGEKQRLLDLTPSTYVGLAAALARAV